MFSEVEKKYITAFNDGVKNTLQTMAFIEPDCTEPFIKKDNTTTGDLTCLIGMLNSVTHSTSTLILTFTDKCCIQIASSMLGEEFAECNAEVRDAIGELSNIISGDSRARLSEAGIKLDGGIPSIVGGENHKIETLTEFPMIAIPFTVKGESMCVYIAFGKDKQVPK